MPAGEVIGYRLQVAPARERGLKSAKIDNDLKAVGRSREGAWIEMVKLLLKPLPLPVAPARERGLKYLRSPPFQRVRGRSREGAWIEILSSVSALRLM